MAQVEIRCERFQTAQARGERVILLFDGTMLSLSLGSARALAYFLQDLTGIAAEGDEQDELVADARGRRPVD